MKLDNNKHSVFLMYYHLILVVKYRKKVIDEPISERLREIFLYISVKYNITLQEWNQDKDHIHILFKGHPHVKYIQLYLQLYPKGFPKFMPNISSIMIMGVDYLG
jgi:putative transposase